MPPAAEFAGTAEGGQDPADVPRLRGRNFRAPGTGRDIRSRSARFPTSKSAQAARPCARTVRTVTFTLNLALALPPDSVQLDVELATKALVIAHAADLLAAASGASAEAIEAALLAREELGSTGVGQGVGLPHARLHVLHAPHAVFLRLAAPIGFDAIDGKPVDLVCAVIAPDEPNAALLTTVSALSRTLRDAARTAVLRGAATSEDARSVLLEGASAPA